MRTAQALSDYHPDVISLRGPRLARGTRGMRGLGAGPVMFEGPTVMDDATGIVLSYSRTPDGAARGGFSRSHALNPWMWTFGMALLGWAGGYGTWRLLARSR